MSELPTNYPSVLDEARFKKKFSPVRFEDMLKRVNAVLEGECLDEFEGWTSEHVETLKEDLEKQGSIC
jgi:hypothetical protein